ncbi:unnamed protein product [Phaeothamnion confervicola]
MSRLEVPSLLVGTLDSLMSLDDDLSRTDTLVENVVRKIEKQYQEVSGGAVTELKVAGNSVERYIQAFEWDYAKYAVRQPLPALVSTMKAGVGKTEEELKNIAAAYTEKTQLVQAAKRKKGGNLTTSDLSEVLTEDKLQGITFMDTEHLVTLVVVLNKTNEEEFLETYHTIGPDIAALGNPDWSNPRNQGSLGKADGQYGPEFTERTAAKGSPVVPGSARKVLQDGEMCLYVVTILRGHYQAGFFDGEEFQPGVVVDYVKEFKVAAKERRLTVRDFAFDPNRATAAREEAEKLTLEMQQLHTGMIRWCKAHYGEAFVAWVHIKVIRAFVESVLRYGLPVDFTSVFLRPNRGKNKQVHTALDGLCSAVPAGPAAHAGGDDDDKAEEYYPYVFLPFNLISASK